MATSSFTKEFIIDTEEQVNQLLNLLEHPAKSVHIDRNITKSTFDKKITKNNLKLITQLNQ